MQEAFLVLARAKREAEARVRRYETEGKASVHKIGAARHAVRSLETGVRVPEAGAAHPASSLDRPRELGLCRYISPRVREGGKAMTTDTLCIDELRLVVLAEPPEAAQIKREAAALGLTVRDEPDMYCEKEPSDACGNYTGPFLICRD
jgi:hypothetical protein